MSVENGLSEQQKFNVKDAMVPEEPKSQYPKPEKPLNRESSMKKEGKMKY